MDERIKVGDAVVLKSGGPVMTVQALSLSLAYCAWTSSDRRHHGTFEVDSLASAERPESRTTERHQDDGQEQPAP